jgi:hypothetical protein
VAAAVLEVLAVFLLPIGWIMALVVMDWLHLLQDQAQITQEAVVVDGLIQ